MALASLTNTSLSIKPASTTNRNDASSEANAPSSSSGRADILTLPAHSSSARLTAQCVTMIEPRLTETSQSTADLSDVCALCLEDFPTIRDNTIYQDLRCEHAFHIECLMEQLARTANRELEGEIKITLPTCALCRDELHLANDGPSFENIYEATKKREQLKTNVELYEEFISDMVEQLDTSFGDQNQPRHYSASGTVFRSFWDKLEGVEDYCQFLGVSKVCLSSISSEIRKIEEKGVSSASHLNKLKALKKEIRETFNLLERCTPFDTITNSLNETQLIDNHAHLEVDVDDLKDLKNTLGDRIKNIELKSLLSYFSLTTDAQAIADSTKHRDCDGFSLTTDTHNFNDSAIDYNSDNESLSELTIQTV